MAAGRIKQEEREQIVKRICIPLQEEVERKAADVVKYINSFTATKISKEIWDFIDKYPGIVPLRSYASPYELSKDNLLDKIHLTGVNQYPSNFFKDTLILSLKKDPEWEPSFNELIENLRQAELKRRAMEGKTSCILQTLNTRKKLREGFPEAYKILVEIVDKTIPGINETLCDSVENLRAELSQYKKKKS